MNRIEVMRHLSDTDAERWTVSVDVTGKVFIRVRRFERLSRKTTRHKWRRAGAGTSWDSFDNRNRWDGFGLPKDEVPPVPDDLRAGIVEKLLANIEWVH